MSAIGIVGGLGPYAGLDLVKKIHDSVDCLTDQDYPDVYIASLPRIIPDRTKYIKNPETQNPAVGISFCIEKIVQMGATHIGIPCNTAHAPIIMNQVRAFIETRNLHCTLYDIVEETYSFAKEHVGKGKIALLATKGTYLAGRYSHVFEQNGHFKIMEPDEDHQNMLTEAIYNRSYGIKAFSKVTDKAKELVKTVIDKMIADGADAVILGCTELPLAVSITDKTVPILDTSLILARALVRAVMPEKLKPIG